MEERTDGPEGGLPGPRRGRAVSADMRGRAVAAVVQRGVSVRSVARQFGLGATTVRRWVKLFRERGHVRPGKRGGGVSRIEPERERIFRILEGRPRLTVRGLTAALAAEGLAFGTATVQRFLKRHGLERERRRPTCGFPQAVPAEPAAVRRAFRSRRERSSGMGTEPAGS